jgi:hypothetical protein
VRNFDKPNAKKKFQKMLQRRMSEDCGGILMVDQVKNSDTQPQTRSSEGIRLK